jgi:hypothetical protein
MIAGPFHPVDFSTKPGKPYLSGSISPEKGFVPNPVADGHLWSLDGLAPMQGFYPRQGHS